ncbi:mannosyl-3-phosphoglycerate phosphatase [Yoonia maricola]|uniref:Mannosyl-3-phosphoglycerate phosphatase n=1 Tax=Yoonia maricola TaxID=420999 RepID=A0A2M8WN63_9RHOB|nr:HAD-IIB family hydrolase [Yoonia maricola]PJI92359.1 mannosyl-3-phosphoglycerate phosphatase [Yoonia maricola]
MPDPCHLLVFTDLDGTLIDHDTYDWAAAKPGLNALNALSAGIILASSKTAAEMAILREKIGVAQWPAIVENGAGFLPPFNTTCPSAADYETIRSALDRVTPDLRQLFTGFGDVTAAQVADMTGLLVRDAALAQMRCFSEPGQWSGTVPQKNAFLAALAEQGVRSQQGGRFLTLSLGRNKVDQMRSIIDTYQPRHTIALGDAPNDIAMLEHADIGIVVANPARPPLPPLKTEAAGRIIRTKEAGPVGWNWAIHTVIDRLEKNRTPTHG